MKHHFAPTSFKTSRLAVFEVSDDAIAALTSFKTSKNKDFDVSKDAIEVLYSLVDIGRKERGGGWW
jgi:hypothetical protein